MDGRFLIFAVRGDRIRHTSSQPQRSSVRPSNRPKNACCKARVIGPGTPVADRLAVDRAHRRDLGGGAGHEDLVGGVQRFARQVALFHRDAQLARPG